MRHRTTRNVLLPSCGTFLVLHILVALLVLHLQTPLSLCFAEEGTLAEKETLAKPTQVGATPVASAEAQVPFTDASLASQSSESSGSSQAAVRKVDLDESINIALESNKQVLIQQQEVERMDAQVIQARSAALPNLLSDMEYVVTKGTMNFGGSGGFTFDLDDDYLGGSVTLAQPIYTAGRTGAAIKAAQVARKYARENLEATTGDVVYQVKASFGGVLLARKMAVLAKEALELAEAHLRNVESLYTEGVASEYELIRARVQVAQLVPERIRAENELDRSLTVFKNTLGVPSNEPIEPDGELERKDVRISKKAAFELASENRHELAAARLRMNGMKLALDLAKADRYPSLSFVGNANMQTDEPTFDSQDWRSRMWSASVVLSMPLFDGLRTKGKIKQTQAEYEQARLYATQMEDLVRLEVEQAVSRLDEARELVDSQSASVDQAEKGLEIANIRYENGVGTQLEVLDAQVSLSRARTDFFMSVYEHFMAVAELERATAKGEF